MWSIVEEKLVKFRPVSEKEKANGEKGVKPMTPTHVVLFKHDKGTGHFKITAQFRLKRKNGKPIPNSGRWLFNLHEPERHVPVEMRVCRTDMVTVSVGEKILKSSSGTFEYELFFGSVLPKRVRCPEFVELVRNRFDGLIGGSKAA